MEENVSSGNCCPRDVYFTKDVEKTNSSGYVDEKEIVRGPPIAPLIHAVFWQNSRGHAR